MYRQIGYSCALLFLAGMAVYDIRWKRIPAAGIAIWGVLSVVYFIMGEKLTVSRVILCMLPGMIMLLLALITAEKIGYGDGMTALVLGFFLGGNFCMLVMGIGIMMTGLWSLYRIICKNREPIPLIPFLLASMEVILIYA